MKEFPIEKIKANKASLSGENGNANIEIEIEPFELEFDEYLENVDTSIRLDGIIIPVDLKELEGKEFCFPKNPNNGYIDGSIYFFAAHNPIDVIKISFGTICSGVLPVTMETEWDLEFENTGFKNLVHKLKTCINL